MDDDTKNGANKSKSKVSSNGSELKAKLLRSSRKINN